MEGALTRSSEERAESLVIDDESNNTDENG
jgi:hypothetical protein